MTPSLVLARVDGVATIQDAGRRGRMHDGVPPGGALVLPLLRRANEALGNPADAPAIEHHGKIEIVAETDATLFADRLVTLAPGERCVVPAPTEMRVGYISIAGGVEAPLFLGGRGAVLSLGHGRLERGARVTGARLPTTAPSFPAPWTPDVGAFEVRWGPDEHDLREAFLAATFRVSPSSDRTGVALDGLQLPTTAADPDATSRPMVRGGIQLPPRGPIVLGPDHPTTGGYPLVAVLLRAAQPRFFALRPGARVRFVTA